MEKNKQNNHWTVINMMQPIFIKSVLCKLCFWSLHTSILTWDWEWQQALLYWSSHSWKDMAQTQNLKEKINYSRYEHFSRGLDDGKEFKAAEPQIPWVELSISTLWTECTSGSVILVFVSSTSTAKTCSNLLTDCSSTGSISFFLFPIRVFLDSKCK